MTDLVLRGHLNVHDVLISLAICSAFAIGAQCRAEVLELSSDGRTSWVGERPHPIGAKFSGQKRSTVGQCKARSVDVNRDRVGDAAIVVELHPSLAISLTCQESRFDPHAKSPKGAYGLMQLMPRTAKQLGVDARNVQSNVEGGTRLLSQLMERYGGDIQKALAAYNAGPAAVDRYGGVPPFAETRGYVANILEQMAISALDSHSSAEGQAE
jgi:hypothetical protein